MCVVGLICEVDKICKAMVCDVHVSEVCIFCKFGIVCEVYTFCGVGTECESGGLCGESVLRGGPMSQPYTAACTANLHRKGSVAISCIQTSCILGS